MARIQLDKVCVDFPVFNATSRSVRLGLLNKVIGGRLSKGKKHGSSVRALDEVTVSFEKGDRVGLVGHNGAGKTTLLRVLAGVYIPTSGLIRCEGRVAPLFDISLGFDLEASGYDNIILRGLFLGLSKAQIEARVDDIAEFTDLGSYLDMPLRTYSSGMLLRLAFAIATEIEPEIILMDEWIGVGDAQFVERAKERLDRFIGGSSIMVLASHSEELIRAICNKAILLGQGQVLAEGSVEDVFHHYHFFGTSHFFDIEQYIYMYPDLQDAMAEPGMAPWMHFIRYGIFEGRSPGRGITIDAFANDPVFQRALAVRDGLAAAERIEEIAPFLKTFTPSQDWRTARNLKYPENFVPAQDYPLIDLDDARSLYPSIA
jgi:ABC-2 type transport system ATP-binding protein